MKKIISPAIILFMIACGTANTNTEEKTFPIPSYQKDPSPDAARHKAGDIEVFRIVAKDTTYFARFYRLDNGELRQYETVVEGSGYDKASYQWTNDSTVAFKFLDSKNNKSHSFQLVGSGASTMVQEIR